VRIAIARQQPHQNVLHTDIVPVCVLSAYYCTFNANKANNNNNNNNNNKYKMKWHFYEYKKLSLVVL